MMIHHALLSGVSAAAITAHLGTPGPSLPWVTVAEWVPNDNSAGWAGYTVRQKILASVLSAEGSMARLTFTAHTTGLAVTNCYIGYAAGSDSDFDFFDVPTQVTFDGGDPVRSEGHARRRHVAGRFLPVAQRLPEEAPVLALLPGLLHHDSVVVDIAHHGLVGREVGLPPDGLVLFVPLRGHAAHERP